MKKLAPALLILMLTAPTVSAAQDPDGFNNPLEGSARDCLADYIDCFRLFNNCEPIDVAIGVLSNELGLTEERVRTAIESRLRSARLYDQNSGPYLSVYVDLFPEEDNTPFSYRLTFRKLLTDDLTGHTGAGSTWSTGKFGITDEAGLILQGISEKMDEFINEYLRVNEPACQ